MRVHWVAAAAAVWLSRRRDALDAAFGLGKWVCPAFFVCKEGFEKKMANKTELLIEALEPVATEHDLDLVTVEVAGTNKNPILRVFLDTWEGGITLDQLADAQEWVDAVVDELDPFQYSYSLEVSSPGIDRPLRKPGDYDRFAGEKTVVYLKPGQARTKYTGLGRGVDGDDVVLEMEDGTEERIAFSRIKRAHIIGRIDFSRKDFGALDAPETTE